MRTSDFKMAAGTTGMSRGAAELLSKGVVVNAAGGKHSATLFFLHGLGDTGHGWAQILTEIRPPSLKIICPTAHGWAQILTEIRPPSLKIICPTAPVAPVTINGGFCMPSWFDIYSLDKAAKQDEEGIQKAAKEIHEILDAECALPGISSDKVILGGFSQGGSLAIFSVLTYPRRLAGILGLSTYISLHQTIEKKITSENKTIPFLQCHGDSDPVVSYKWGQMSSQFITSFNSDNYKFNTYPGLGHSSCPEEMRDIQEWLNKVLNPSGANL